MSGSPSSEPASTESPGRVERSAGGVVLRRGGDGLRVLVILDPYGKWGLPKGHLEEGETPPEAALREVREETGLEEVEMGRLVETIDWRFPDDGAMVHKFCVFYLMHSPHGAVEPEIEEGIRECVWLPFEAAVERLDYANARPVLRAAREMVLSGEHSLDL